MTFVLDPKLTIDSEFICDLPLSQIRLHNNAAFPWILLIPRRMDVVEWIDLLDADQVQMFKELKRASQVMQEIFQPKKLNIANLGNIVAQLHIHVIARFHTDEAWPHPVWSSGVRHEYAYIDKKHIIALLANKFDI